jgi:hypothetical protein
LLREEAGAAMAQRRGVLQRRYAAPARVSSTPNEWRLRSCGLEWQSSGLTLPRPAQPVAPSAVLILSAGIGDA